jgi:4-amino-4-deoxy-L-arabinose transferase-like glycosyltransferase
MKKLWHKYLTFALFCVVIYFPVFLHLDREPIHNWDESLFAMRAGYMAEEGQYLPSYKHWVDDGYRQPNTKPPFTTFIQALSFKLLGINELALRLPIALCVLALLFSMVWFARDSLGDARIGYCAGFVLVTSVGFVRAHGSRTGDQDAALAFYMMAGAMAFYHYLKSIGRQDRLGWLALFTLANIAAVLTKYAFGLLFFPAFLGFSIYEKKFLAVLKDGWVWLSMLVVGAATAGWLYYIEQQIPGYFQRAFSHEMADRLVTVIDQHDHPFCFYLCRFWTEGFFMPWLILLISPILQLFFDKKSPERDFSLLMLLCAGSVLLLISFSRTKTDHYDMVAYPPLAVLAGMGLLKLGTALRKLWVLETHRPTAVMVAALGVVLLIVNPYQTILSKVYMTHVDDPAMSYAYLLRKVQKTQPACKHFTVFSPIHIGQVNFYAGLLNRKKGYRIKLSEHPESTQVGDTVLACEPRFLDSLLANYEVVSIETEGPCRLVKAIAKKGQAPQEGDALTEQGDAQD